MPGEALFREHGKQVAALCWRHAPKRNSQIEILLVTSLNSKRWILPKGWLEPELSAAENAAREAFEAVVLRHPDLFSVAAVSRSRERLEELRQRDLAASKK